MENEENSTCECTQCERGRSCYVYEKYQRLPRQYDGHKSKGHGGS